MEVNMENVSASMNDSADVTTINPSLYMYNARIGVACFWLLASFLGLVGNSLVIWAVVLSKKLRTTTNAFVVNLSLADFWTSLGYPWVVVALLSPDNTWPLKTEVPCIIAAVQLYTGLGTSMYTLATIAVNRLVLVTQSIETYNRWYTRRRITVMIAATWFIPFAIFLLPPVFGVGAIGYDPTDNTCSDKDGHPRGPAYNKIQSFGLFPVPMTTIIIAYTMLYVHIRRHFKNMKQASTNCSTVDTESSTTAEGFTSYITGSSKDDRVTIAHAKANKRQRISHQQLSITKNLFVVFCTFAVLLTPYFVSLAVQSSRKFAVYGATIAILNSCVNPIIYTINHPHFKVVMRRIIQCRYSEIPEPSNVLKSLLRLLRKE